GEVTFDLDAGADAQPRERAAEPVEAALGDLDARADDLRDSGDRLGAFVDRHAIVMPYAMHLVLEHLSGLERDANPLGRSLGSDPRLTPHDLQGTSGLVDHPRVTDRGHQCSRTEGHRGVATWATVVGIVGIGLGRCDHPLIVRVDALLLTRQQSIEGDVLALARARGGAYARGELPVAAVDLQLPDQAPVGRGVLRVLGRAGDDRIEADQRGLPRGCGPKRGGEQRLAIGSGVVELVGQTRDGAVELPYDRTKATGRGNRRPVAEHGDQLLDAAALGRRPGAEPDVVESPDPGRHPAVGELRAPLPIGRDLWPLTEQRAM